MATLPRTHNSKHGNNISSPFSTSPRKLQEMTLPQPECHDVTNVSACSSMKQYEEQLNGLRKENFNLKLRIYFLEEKLGSGAPPAVQGLLEHNVRLQVEVEELRRQLTDKQELLAAAAEAIDVLEQQGSLSTDSVEATINGAALKKETNSQTQVIEKKEVLADDTCAESESVGDYLGVSVNHGDMDELVKLRRENRKALQMIKGCLKKIQQQDKEIKKLKLNKELAYAHISDSQLEKYEEILKCKDEHIKDLENKIRELQKSVQNDDAAGNLQQLLTRRLQGLAYFLDKLLSHKCVLGEEKKKLAESILEQSLALPVGLKLDESMAPEDFTMDESNMDISQSLRIEDLTMMFGHHVMCSDENNRSSSRKPLKHFPQADVISESECWSEPDRNVSLARVGLCDTGVAVKESTSENTRYRSRRSRVSYGSRSDDNKTTNESALLDEINQLTERSELLEEENGDLKSKLDFAKKQIDDLISEKDELKQNLNLERANNIDISKKMELTKDALFAMESKVQAVEKQFAEASQLIEKLRMERQELEATYLETERALRRAADEATVQASQAALERARAQHDRLKVERELEETREKLANVMEINAQLEIEATRKVALEAENKIAIVQDVLHSEEDRPTSPDLGIDSDRLSSLEQNDAVALSPRSLYAENQTLKQKLARTKATLAETLAQLNAANLRKRSVQRAICREIHKTQGVLRKARDQFENQN